MRHAHVYLVAILLLHIGIAALSEAYFWLYVPDGEGLAEAAWMVNPAIYWVPLMAWLYLWCVVDAKDRHVQPPFGAAIVVTLVFPIGVPYYYWRTYPPRAAMVHIGSFTIFVAACVAASRLGGMLAHYYFLTST